ncbi:sodium:proton antiporter NhaD [Shewanella sp. AS1]|uniref:sodium:proton antiporter NhaD n=1 Tax=Shewanella sp. AS1 TaxID=2907626 RepID=UPI001F38C383|nr:sodium:proton antiporter NhaD [Shewanella sp. AS1]MCE9677692.1 sodium:proton antiporter NhaD [Shewanella sp. AS1]
MRSQQRKPAKFLPHLIRFFTLICVLFAPGVFASDAENTHAILDLTATTAGYLCVTIFILAYLLVMGEEVLHLRKSKPVLIAAGFIWGVIGYIYVQNGMSELSEAAFKHNLLEYAELLLFLLVAMTYISAMEERNLFDALRSWMILKGFSLRTVFWLTGFMAFFISPIADNLTTALLMCAVVMKVGGDNKGFISIACINIVVAANAGGAFSPFGDITTLMVWQKGTVHFSEFLHLFIPSLVNYLVPAAIMSFFIKNTTQDTQEEKVRLKRGARRIVVLFLLTITTAVCTHSLLGLPPVLGMMTGLGFLQLFGFFLRKSFPKAILLAKEKAKQENDLKRLGQLGNVVPFDVFRRIAQAEWDTLLFFYGVVLCVGGLGFMGYLSLVSEAMYSQWDVTYANVAVGVLSAIVDNIPVMFAVLTMNPDMVLGQWLLVTLTAGVGGSLLSIGSAAGVALMGQARGNYTFIGHLKWTPVIALGYIASILVHLWLNSALF